MLSQVLYPIITVLIYSIFSSLSTRVVIFLKYCKSFFIFHGKELLIPIPFFLYSKAVIIEKIIFVLLLILKFKILFNLKK